MELLETLTVHCNNCHGDLGHTNIQLTATLTVGYRKLAADGNDVM